MVHIRGRRAALWRSEGAGACDGRARCSLKREPMVLVYSDEPRCFFLGTAPASGGGAASAEKSSASQSPWLASISSSSSGWSGSVFLIRKNDVSYVTGPA